MPSPEELEREKAALEVELALCKSENVLLKTSAMK